MTVANVDHTTLRLFCDGGVIGGRNPGTGIYYSVGKAIGEETEILSRHTIMSLYTTNNESELLALNDAINCAAREISKDVSRMTEPFNESKVQKVLIHSDSQLIVNQFNGNWICSNERLVPLLQLCRRNAAWLKGMGVDLKVVWVKREVNVKRLGH